MTHAEFQEQLAAYALGSLHEADARDMAYHLAGCPECREELASLERTASFLVHESEPVDPPPLVREQIAARIAAKPQTEKAPQAPQRPTPAVKPTRAAGSVRRRPRRQGPGFLPIAAGLAAAAVFVGLVLAHEHLSRRLEERRADIGRLEAALQKTRTELAQAKSRLDDTERALLRFADVSKFLSSLDVYTVHLAGTDNAPAAEAKLAFDRKTGRVLLFAANLPSPPPDKAYQLWFFDGGQPLPGGVFQSARPGLVALDDRIPAEARESPKFAVTLEPATGVPAPTGAIVLGPRG